jgi:DNA-directed RNA polymerase subunit RPC12/RpoP
MIRTLVTEPVQAPVLPLVVASPALSPWWGAGLRECHTCGDCHQPFDEEASFYCHGCGRDLCPECAEALQETREIQCRHCAAENR